MSCKILSILKYILTFIIFSFIGSLIEYLSLYIGGSGISYDKMIFLLTGLKIYFIPIYGLAGILMFLLEKVMNKLKVRFYFRGLIHGLIITLIELIFGNLGNLIFNIDFWNYSDHFLNIGKYISGKMFLVWTSLGYVFSAILLLINYMKKELKN